MSHVECIQNFLYVMREYSDKVYVRLVNGL